jgi:hypothetical protein
MKYHALTPLRKQLMNMEMTEGIQRIIDKSRIWRDNLNSQIDNLEYLIRISKWFEKYNAPLPVLNRLRKKLCELKITKCVKWLKWLKLSYPSINPDLMCKKNNQNLYRKEK